MNVIILGIESSCDETAAAIVQDGRRLLSNVVHTQIDIHSHYGGVVPEVAARSHIEVINPVVNQVLKDASLTWDDIDAIAVTYAPGLIGSLLVGTLVARTLAILKNKPLYAIHHVEAHVYANFLTEVGGGRWYMVDGSDEREPSSDFEDSAFPAAANQERKLNQLAVSGSEKSEEGLSEQNASNDEGGGEQKNNNKLAGLVLPSKQPDFPMLALIVSGNHSQLVLFHDHGNYELLGQTQDDAIGEAFDKVAKILGLPYPGGPSISKLAKQGDPHKYKLPKAKLQNPLDYSFSGLKTAVLRAVQRETGVDYTFPSFKLAERLSDTQRADFAASFQQIAVETLVDKTEKAFHAYTPKSVVIAGGVAANQELRRQLSERLPIAIEYAPIQLCTDNGAMVATLAYYHSQKNQPADPFTLEVVPSLSMQMHQA